MNQHLMSEKAQNEVDATGLAVFSGPHSASPHHKPGHGGIHHHHESHQHGEFQDSHDGAFSHHSHHHGEAHHHGGAHHSHGLASPHGAVLSYPPYGEDNSHHFDGEHHHGSRMHHYGSHHHGESYQHDGPHHHEVVSHHSGLYHCGETHHHGGPHHHGEFYQHSGPHCQDEASYHGGLYPHSGPRHHGEYYLHGGPQHHDEASHHSGLYLHGGPHHHGEASHHRGLHHHGESFHHGGSYHREAYHHGRTHHHGEHHHGEHHTSEHHRGEHHHSKHHHGEHHHGEHHHGEHHHGERHGEHHHAFQLFAPFQSHSKLISSFGSAHTPITTPYHSMTPIESLAQGIAPSRTAVHAQGFQTSSKVHPQRSSSRAEESWQEEEDEQFPKHKIGRTQRAHKKLHSENFFHWLLEKLIYLIQGLRRMLRDLTQSLAFEAFIFTVVCLNTIVLVAQTFAEVEIRGEWYFVAMDSVFLCIYVVEAVLKIIALGFKYFSDSWNNLDFFIMVMALLDFVLMQLNSLSSHSVHNQSIFRVLKVLKSLRALRAIRVLQRLSFLTSLQEVAGTLARSLPSITAILFLMFTCLFFSVVLWALFRHSDPKRFRNIFTTIFTLFTLLTLDDWSLIYLDSRAQGAWYIIPILMVYIIIQYFIFLNLVIAVLVDNFQMALLQGLEKVKQEKAARIHEKLLDDSLTELSMAELEEKLSEGTMRKQLIEKKFGTLTKKQQELLFHYLQLVAAVEHHQQKFRSQASVIDEIVDTTFEAGEEDFRK